LSVAKPIAWCRRGGRLRSLICPTGSIERCSDGVRNQIDIRSSDRLSGDRRGRLVVCCCMGFALTAHMGFFEPRCAAAGDLQRHRGHVCGTRGHSPACDQRIHACVPRFRLTSNKPRPGAPRLQAGSNPVGWVERSETHRMMSERNDGFRKELNPSYGLIRVE